MRVHHLAFRTGKRVPSASDPHVRLERFYVDAVGLAVIRRDGERSVWLDAGGSLVMLERREHGEPATPRGSMDLIAFAVAPESRALSVARLERAGVVVEGSTDFTLYVRDPDGRRIGLSSYPAPLV